MDLPIAVRKPGNQGQMMHLRLMQLIVSGSYDGVHLKRNLLEL